MADKRVRTLTEKGMEVFDQTSIKYYQSLASVWTVKEDFIKSTDLSLSDV